MSKIVGTYRDETITGSVTSDRIWGGDGDDFVFGRAGKDMLSDVPLEKPTPYSSFDDWYFGGQGSDIISTVSGRDHLHGGRGGDTFFGNSADSFFVDGGRGRDVLHISDRLEIISQDGDDTVLRKGDQVIRVEDVEHIVFHDW